MQVIINLINKLKNIQAIQNSACESVLSRHADYIAELNREQLFKGRGSDGELLRPFYNEDDFFKTPEAAEKYAVWKEKISPSEYNRPKYAPNLWINGQFHDTIQARAEITGIKLFTTSSQSEKITQKFTKSIGLNNESITKIIQTQGDDIIRTMRNEIFSNL